MPIIDHATCPVFDRAPGVTRQMIVEQDTGSGAVSTGLVTMQPGASIPLHYHLVEEAILIIEGEGEAVLGPVTSSVAAGMSVLAPAGTPHTLRNSGRIPMRLVIAYPAVNVQAFPVTE